ncbi:MAG: helix-turn-helix transcriptional regulator [Bdellovibrionales bacterium]
MTKWTADNIRELRWRLGWSQAELARQLGCRQQTISEWETGLYEPQNAYSKLLDQMSDRSEFYRQQIRVDSAAENVLRQAKQTQVSTDEVMEYLPTFDPQID